MNTAPHFVIFASYGNDSVALIQLAHELKLENVAVVYSDTGWSTADWRLRVAWMEDEWVPSLGFTPHRTTSVGFGNLARSKKGFPTQRYQWCSYILKIEPGMRWLEINDPDRRAVCMVGVRNEEAADVTSTRATFPEYMMRSENHGGRLLMAPMAKWTEEARDALVKRAGFDVLPHRSRECKCINSNRADMRMWTEQDLQEMEALEKEVGKPIFRAARHMGAQGVREVKRWADSPRGKFEKDLPQESCASDGLWCGS